MLLASIKMALDGLINNKMRSLLTMLGIIIGVGAVIAMVSLGLSVRDRIQNSIASLGSNLIIVTPGGTSPTGQRLAAGSGARLTYDDAKAIAKNIEGINYVSPSVNRSYQVIYGNQNWNTMIEGNTPEFLNVRNFSVEKGEFFGTREMDARTRVAVIGSTVAENLFLDSEPIGQTIRINKAPFRVIGVLSSKGQSAMGTDQDDFIVVPLTTAMQRMMGINFINRISIQAASDDVINYVQQDITQLLRVRHRLQNKSEDDFTVRNLASVMAAAEETTNNMTILLGNVAGISLLVGGIGIMNIMLVSVTERTREIGIRKALGATYRNILLQFLIEAVFISVVGGTVGILTGIVVSFAIAKYLGFAMAISMLAVVVAFAFSVFIGLFFGIYPARKAALLDPIEALRYE